MRRIEVFAWIFVVSVLLFLNSMQSLPLRNRTFGAAANAKGPTTGKEKGDAGTIAPVAEKTPAPPTKKPTKAPFKIEDDPEDAAPGAKKTVNEKNLERQPKEENNGAEEHVDRHPAENVDGVRTIGRTHKPATQPPIMEYESLDHLADLYSWRCPAATSIFEAITAVPSKQRYQMTLVWAFASAAGGIAAEVDFETSTITSALLASKANQVITMNLRATDKTLSSQMSFIHEQVKKDSSCRVQGRLVTNSDLLDTEKFSTLVIGTIRGAEELVEDIIMDKIRVKTYVIVIDGKDRKTWQPLMQKFKGWHSEVHLEDHGIVVFRNPISIPQRLRLLNVQTPNPPEEQKEGEDDRPTNTPVTPQQVMKRVNPLQAGRVLNGPDPNGEQQPQEYNDNVTPEFLEAEESRLQELLRRAIRFGDFGAQRRIREQLRLVAAKKANLVRGDPAIFAPHVEASPPDPYAAQEQENEQLNGIGSVQQRRRVIKVRNKRDQMNQKDDDAEPDPVQERAVARRNAVRRVVKPGTTDDGNEDRVPLPGENPDLDHPEIKRNRKGREEAYREQRQQVEDPQVDVGEEPLEQKQYRLGARRRAGGGREPVKDVDHQNENNEPHSVRENQDYANRPLAVNGRVQFEHPTQEAADQAAQNEYEANQHLRDANGELQEEPTYRARVRREAGRRLTSVGDAQLQLKGPYPGGLIDAHDFCTSVFKTRGAKFEIDALCRPREDTLYIKELTEAMFRLSTSWKLAAGPLAPLIAAFSAMTTDGRVVLGGCYASLAIPILAATVNGLTYTQILLNEGTLAQCNLVDTVATLLSPAPSLIISEAKLTFSGHSIHSAIVSTSKYLNTQDISFQQQKTVIVIGEKLEHWKQSTAQGVHLVASFDLGIGLTVYRYYQ